MSEHKTITLNGKQYIEYNANEEGIKPALKTDHIIVIAHRGWIFEGYQDKSVTDKIQLLKANVVRSWDTGKGIGGLAESKKGYTLDPVGDISFFASAVIAVINIKW